VPASAGQALKTFCIRSCVVPLRLWEAEDFLTPERTLWDVLLS
jgi:hypothetical protein